MTDERTRRKEAIEALASFIFNFPNLFRHADYSGEHSPAREKALIDLKALAVKRVTDFADALAPANVDFKVQYRG